MERTLIILKPDAVKRQLVGKILSMFEKKGINICDIKMIRPIQTHIDKHYEKFLKEDFFTRLVKYMTSGNVIVCVLKGYNVVSAVRKMIGATDPSKADPESIRGKYASSYQENLIHASDTTDEFNREYIIWFDTDHDNDNKEID